MGRTTLLATAILAASCAHGRPEPSEPPMPEPVGRSADAQCVAAVTVKDASGGSPHVDVEVLHPQRKLLTQRAEQGRAAFAVPCGQWHHVRVRAEGAFAFAPFVALEPRLDVTLRLVKRGETIADADRVAFGPTGTRGATVSELARLGMKAWGGGCEKAGALIGDAGASHSPDPVVAHSAALSAFGLCSKSVTAAHADRLLAELDPTAPWLSHWLAGVSVALERASDENLRTRVRAQIVESGDAHLASWLVMQDMAQAHARADIPALEVGWHTLSHPRFRNTMGRLGAELYRPDSTRLLPGEPLPALSGTTLDGTAFALDREGATPTLVYAWATYCKPCIPGLAKLVRLRETNPGTRIVTLALDDERDTVRAWVEKKGPFPFPIVTLDADQRLAFERDFGTSSVPACFLAEAGRVVATGRDCAALVDGAASDRGERQERP